MLVLVFTSKIWLGLGQISDSSNLGNPVRDVLLRKKPAFVLDLVQITPPPPNLDNLYNFFSNVEIQDLKESLGLKILYIHYNIL